MMDAVTKMIGEEIPALMKLLPAEERDKENDGKIIGGVFEDVSFVFLEITPSLDGHTWRSRHTGRSR